MIYSFLATIVLIFHTFLVIIVFFGAFLAICGRLKKIPWLERIYFLSGLFIIASYLLFGACNLTLLEQSLWKKANSPMAYEGGCISHYLAFFGIYVSDDMVFWFIVSSLILGFGSSLSYHLFPKLIRSGKAEKTG